MRSVALTALVIAGLATTISAESAKPRKPRLDLRAMPRMAFSPVNVMLTAELTGGDEVEDYYCPALVWDWDDGGKSMHESDCAPLGSGGTFERRFTAEHAYRQAGTYTIKITMRRANRTIAAATTTVTVRPGAGDFASSDPN